MKLLRLAFLTTVGAGVVVAQAPAPAGPKDAIRNGGFERTLQAPNLWSGVDKDGFLAGFRGFLPMLNESGSIAESPMPVGVSVGDLNGDGLSDILSSDPLGYIRIYFNSGSKEAPKFATGASAVAPWPSVQTMCSATRSTSTSTAAPLSWGVAARATPTRSAR